MDLGEGDPSSSQRPTVDHAASRQDVKGGVESGRQITLHVRRTSGFSFQVTHKSLQLAPIIMAIAAPQGGVSDCRVGDVIGETNAEQVAELCVIGKKWCREFHLSDQVRVVNRITSIIMATAEEDLPALLIHRTDSDPPTSSVSHREDDVSTPVIENHHVARPKNGHGYPSSR